MTRFLRRNLGLKIFSLVLAYLTWAVVVGRSPGLRFINAPIELEPPDGMFVIGYQPREVRVRLEGDAPQLTRLAEQNVYARVRLDARSRVGSQRISVQERDLQGIPSGIAREIVDPLITATLERRATRMVEVRPRFTGEPARGYRIVRTEIDPPVVEVSGPEPALRSIEAVLTEPLDPTARNAPFAVRADLVRPDPLVTLKPNQVRATVIIEEIPVVLDLELPIVANDPGFAPETARVRVRLEGPPSLLKRLRERVSALADIGALEGRTATAPVRLDMGDLTAGEQGQVRIVGMEPQKVRVRRAQQ